jgi:hypothetical protein
MRVESDLREMWGVGKVTDADKVGIEVAICEEMGSTYEACNCKRYLCERCDIGIRLCRSQRKVCWRRAEECVGVDIRNSYACVCTRGIEKGSCIGWSNG